MALASGQPVWYDSGMCRGHERSLISARAHPLTRVMFRHSINNPGVWHISSSSQSCTFHLRSIKFAVLIIAVSTADLAVELKDFDQAYLSSSQREEVP